MTSSHSRRAGIALSLSVLLGLPLGVVTAGTASASPLPQLATVTTDLCATAGTMSLPSTPTPITVNVWGYTDCSVSTITKPGGPTLTFAQGDTVNITLHNNLPVDTGLVFPGIPQPPDTVGVAPGLTKDYSFTASKPGTFLYEAALLPNAQYQVAMGLYGAMTVTPTPTPTPTAYADALPTQHSAFDTSATLVLSEIDPALNNAANPASFNMRTFAPKYGLINGAVHPNTANIPALAGNKVLLRYVNAGLKLHSMAALGVHQTVIANDGNELKYPHKIVAETFGPGQTADVIATLPSTAPAKYAIYDGSLTLHNNGSGTGGMLTFIEVTGTATTATTPITSSVAVSPPTSNGSAPVTVTANVASSTALSDVPPNVPAEFFIDIVGANGAGAAMTAIATTGGFTISGSIPALTLSGGTHVVYVHAQNASGWGPVSSTAVNIDNAGPSTTSLVVTPAITNGTVDVLISGSGDDRTTGNSNVTAAEYFTGAVGANGTGIPMTVGTANPVVALSTNPSHIPAASFQGIPAATVLGFGDGPHTISVHSKDELGNWGPITTVVLTVDLTGPVASGATSATPNPNDGTLGVSSGVPAVRVTSTFTDAISKVVGAEGFIDTIGANGTGFVFTPTSGTWTTTTAGVFSDIPLATIAALSQSTHTIYVHAKDAAGNWGTTAPATLIIDKQGPVVTSVTVAPVATNASSVAITAAVSDTTTGGLNITGGEFFIDTAGANGTGTAMAVAAALPTTSLSATIPSATVAALAPGVHTIRVHGKDALNHWGALIDGTLLIDRTAPTVASVALTPNTIVQGTASVTGTVTATDPAPNSSGVAGGEYWLDGTTTPGSVPATAFTGLTPSITTTALAPGQHQVRVRVRDVAGNWSTGANGVRSATLTVTFADAIFANGFETGTGATAWGWTSRSTNTTSRLNVTATAALTGAQGLQAQGNNTNDVQWDFPTGTAVSTYDARFYVNLNGNASTGKDIFAAATGGGFGTQLFHVRYRLSGTQQQVQLQDGAASNTNWVNVAAGNHRIEVVWQAVGSGGPNPGTLELYVDGVSVQTIGTTSTGSVGSVRLGSVTATGANRLMFFDAFSSKRTVTPLIGP